MANYKVIRSDELYHYGILGMKWGVRRYQNSDGTRTTAGKKRYAKSNTSSQKHKTQKKAKSSSENEIKKYVNKANAIGGLLTIIQGLAIRNVGSMYSESENLGIAFASALMQGAGNGLIVTGGLETSVAIGRDYLYGTRGKI